MFQTRQGMKRNERLLHVCLNENGRHHPGDNGYQQNYLKETFRDDQDVARAHWRIGGNVTLLDQVV